MDLFHHYITLLVPHFQLSLILIITQDVYLLDTKWNYLMLFLFEPFYYLIQLWHHNLVLLFHTI